VAGRPAVFVPFPHATHDHQTANARFLERAGAARIVPQAELERTDLAGLVLHLLETPDELRAMGARARELGNPDAAAAVVAELERLATAA
jgi:UDP-N-acetylglucosamine--N-acetylmuramyl-(pentapeptide) pyrophosphoryl-undecaprenol N-acetylglucosamine transferase